MSDRIDQAITIWERMTWNRLAMAALTAAIALLGTYSWEHRDTVVPAIVGSTVATIGVSVALALGAIGIAGSFLLGRMDRQSDALDGFLKSELLEAKQEILQVRKEMGELATRERECQMRLMHQDRQIVRLGGDPTPTDWGSL